MDFNLKLKFKQIKIKESKKLLAEGKQDVSLTNILSSEECKRIIHDCREFRDRIYTPLKTLLIFTKQILNPDKSCRNAVASIVAEQISTGRQTVSANTGPYCKARERLPEFAVKTLVNEVGNLSEKKTSKKWKWRGHEVKLVDGTTIKMPDTNENRQVFSRHNNHAGDVGFPLARLVVIISLAIGTVIDYAIAASKGIGTGEHSLFRNVLCCLNVGDILLGDCYYPSFFLIFDLRF